MPEDLRADAVAMRLREHKVLVSTAAPYAMTGRPPHAIRLALGSVSHEALTQTFGRVVEVLRNLDG